MTRKKGVLQCNCYTSKNKEKFKIVINKKRKIQQTNKKKT